MARSPGRQLRRIAEDAIEEKDAERAAWAAQQSMLAHAGLVFERDLKPRIWRGYGNVGADQLGEALGLWDRPRTTMTRASGRTN